MPKYLIRASRYINGEVVQASPEFPAVVELPEGHKVDAGLVPVDAPEAAAKLKQHFVDRGTNHPQSSRELQSKPLDEPKAGKKGRASDSDAI